MQFQKLLKLDHILPLIEYGHRDFGENKVQEAIEKWTDIKSKNKYKFTFNWQITNK